MFLTPTELHALTGYRRPSAQIRWLRSHGIEPFVSALGQVQVTHDIVAEMQRIRSGLEARKTLRQTRPNLSLVT
jgi:hypothetical protein